ncbi:DUF896 domain-containing protein [Aerococcus christensenii]|uniref:UPF0291 protein HMPREF3187_00945 n=1 Tax=Aerococcus christensenii TaxID=87541 RepID=A0A133XZF3_9LACT|nr:DUF896 domain-containing protein [Aerococcus christensenii]KXB36304.1 hypothetical protein HMPREF3187_00945 [Aerococcus christensenii]MDK8234675.1 DUF896 domain-containing protein [Aerococcus christensenii]WEB71091.1 DUF896 domain-containing protein [Aerococcus christensenii]
MDTLIQRINALAAKQKADELSPEEKVEQAQLRQEYLKIFRGNFKQVLMNTKVVDPKGKDITPSRLKKAKKKR